MKSHLDFEITRHSDQRFCLSLIQDGSIIDKRLYIGTAAGLRAAEEHGGLWVAGILKPTPRLEVIPGNRRRPENTALRSRIQRLRIVELHCHNAGLHDASALTRTVIDELVAEVRKIDAIGTGANWDMPA